MLIQLYTDDSCFKQLEREWFALLQQSTMNTIFLTPLWLECWWSVFGHKRGELALVTARDERGSLVAIAPFFIAQERGQKVGYLVGEPDLCDYGNLIVRSGYEQEILPQILTSMRELFSWDRLEIYGIPEESIIYETMRMLRASNGLKLQEEFLDHCPFMVLPPTWEQYLEGLRPKDRHELKRKLRRWEGQDDINWYLPSSHERLMEDLEAFLALHRNSKREKERFMDDNRSEFFFLLGRRLFDEGWLYLPFLEKSGQKVASFFCIDYNSTVNVYNSGFDLRFSQLSPGLVCLALGIKDAISRGRTCFDFLRGEEEYKYRFGAKDRPILSLTIFR